MNWQDWVTQKKENLFSDFDSYPKRKFVLFFLLVFIFLWLIFSLWRISFLGQVAVFEESLMGVVKGWRNAPLDLFFGLVTQLGSNPIIAILFLLAAVLLFLKRRRRAATVVLLTLLGSRLAIFFLKDFFGRPRPYGCQAESGLGCDSYPSGHATSALYFYGILLYLTLRFGQISYKNRLAMILGTFVLVLLIAFSRVYLGQHYPTDVIGGLLLGGIFLHAGIILIDFLYSRWTK